MQLREGKNIESLLAGKVKNPIKEDSYRSEVRQKGINNLRRELERVLDNEMDHVRKDQMDENPSNPKSYFAKNLLSDLDEAMNFILEVEDGERYDLRFYSANDTRLDYLGSFDCWVELYDLKEDKPLANFKIDLTTNPNKQFPSNFADGVFYFNSNYLDEEAKGKISPKFFEDPEYKSFLVQMADIIKKQANIQPSN